MLLIYVCRKKSGDLYGLTYQQLTNGTYKHNVIGTIYLNINDLKDAINILENSDETELETL